MGPTVTTLWLESIIVPQHVHSLCVNPAAKYVVSDCFQTTSIRLSVTSINMQKVHFILLLDTISNCDIIQMCTLHHC